ncbi:unnamed protein product [Candidula unifasciata]|uniref:Cytosolic fatty-acid binding proteins domain-containing protein n=1 Tax=Candidula unifasciata TaxID=100452 RepID=A0A8S3ZIV6_9EUPU|nr:unnamed protein product [Candidula unifasciata]
MVEKLLGHWKLESSENFDEYMKAMKVNIVLRKIGNSITSYFEICKDGDTWTLHITSTFKNQTLVFKLGEPVDETTLDGRKCKSTFTVEGNVLAQQQDAVNSSDTSSKYEYEVREDGKLYLTCISVPTNVVSTRIFLPYTP